MPRMHGHLVEVFAKLDASRAALREAIAAIPIQARPQRPAPDRWAPVEIVEHLSLVERRFADIVGGKITEALAAGLGPESGARDPLPPTVSGMLADRGMRRDAPELARPSGRLGESEAWAAAERARADFRAVVASGDSRALSTVIHAHPFFGALNVYQWVELIAGHEMRHVQQLREAAQQLTAQA
jgi:hypothetical protein